MAKVEEPEVTYQRSPHKMTIEEYWAYEYEAESRHEYHDGILVKMGYTSVPHGQICRNLVGLLFNCLRGKDCEVFSETRMIYIPECNKNFYPDVIMVCEKHETRQVSKQMAATMNPSVVIEILSDSTEDFDKTKKARCYKKIKSLKQLVFISQNMKYINVLNRTENERAWLEIDAEDDDDIVELGDCELTLKEIYEKVELDNAPESVSDI